MAKNTSIALGDQLEGSIDQQVKTGRCGPATKSSVPVCDCKFSTEH